jgi:hypothetical protein
MKTCGRGHAEKKRCAINRRIEGENIPGLEGNIAQAEAHLDELNNRLEGRRTELAMERHLAIGDIEHLGCAWVLPHPQRTAPGIAPMVRDEEIERIISPRLPNL